MSVSQGQSPIHDLRIGFVGKLGSMSRREAREIVKKHGATMVHPINDTVNLIVVGADELPLGEHDELLEEWTIQAAAEGRLEIVNESQFWQDLGLVDDDVDVNKFYTPAMLAGLLDLPIATIRRWIRRGLITPARKIHKLAYFDFQEVASARRIAKIIASGATPSLIESKLSRLADLFPNLQRPLSQLSVIVEGKDVLLRHGEGLVEPGGQMRIDFDANEAQEDDEEAVIKIDQPPHSNTLEMLATPAEFIEVATGWEDEGEYGAAIEAYRSMLLAFGPMADICFRMAELLYQQNDLSAARERYYIAIELDEEYVEARASLGCVLVDLKEYEMACSAFRGALEHHPDYPDVHFHFAKLLDEMNQPDSAEIHWQQFLQLAPKSPWAEEARERLRRVT